MKALRRVLLRIYVHLGNLVSDLLPDAPGFFQLRAVILNSFGNRISYQAKICSGTRVLGGGLSIARGVFVNRNCYFDLTGHVEIDSDCEIGHGTVFITARHEIGPSTKRCGAISSAGIHVGQGAWIAAESRLMPGIGIGSGAVVAAGSVVTRSVPTNTLVGGIPAREIRALDAVEIPIEAPSVPARSACA